MEPLSNNDAYWFRHHERRNLDWANEVSGPWSSKRFKTIDQLQNERNEQKTFIDTEQTIIYCTFFKIALFFFFNALPRNISTDAYPTYLQKYRSLFSLVTFRSMNRFSPVTCCNGLMIGSERSLMFYLETNIHPVCECSGGLSMLGTISTLWQKKTITVEHWKHIQKMEELLKNETVKKKIKTLSVEIRVSHNECF